MICPFCAEDVGDESYFCDRCGREIMICPKCGKPGKRKKCVHDASDLVAARTRAGLPAVSHGEQATSKHAAPTPAKARATSSRGSELHLINRKLDLDLKITGDEIIGREVGRFADIFEEHRRVSGQHCQIKFDRKQGWSVVDLGSTHGTRLNNAPLQPEQAEPLTDKSFLLIANIEFYVEMRDVCGRGKSRSS